MSKVDCQTCTKNGRCSAQIDGGTCHYIKKDQDHRILIKKELLDNIILTLQCEFTRYVTVAEIQQAIQDAPSEVLLINPKNGYEWDGCYNINNCIVALAKNNAIRKG